MDSTAVIACSRPGDDAAGGRDGGFFTHHGAWAPGVRLFRRLSFRSKAWLISVLFVVPIVALGAAYLRQAAGALETAERELTGAAYARELLPLIDALQQQRLLAIQADAQRESDAARKIGDLVAANMKRVQALQVRHGATFGTAEAADVLRANIEKAARTAPGNPLASYKRHSQAVDAALALLDLVTDRSGLALDPALDTHYLIDSGLVNLPRMVNSTLAVADLALVLQRGGNRGVVVADVAAQRAIGAHVDALVRQGLDNVNARHPEYQKSLVYASTQDAMTKVHELTSAVNEEDWKGDATALLAAREAMSERALALRVVILGKFDALMAKRVHGITTQRALLLSLLAVSLMLAAYMFISFSRVMRGGLAEVRRHLRAMTEGDLTTVPRPWGKDEAAHLMLALREMQDALRGIVQQVRQSSEDIVSGSQLIASDAAELSSRSEASAVSLQRSATSMNQIEAIVRGTAERAVQASEIGRVNVDAAERGGRVIGEVITTMQDIHASSRRIGEIIGVIDGIAFQTNILALNAAVEAARAGDQGRGFSVVAAEVRTLAQRSATAAREIKALVGSSVDKVSAGAGVVQGAGGVIGEIVDASQRVNALLEQIAQSTREQALGVTEVGSNVGQIDAVTQDNTALVQETATAAHQLQAQARVLAQRVARFRLPGQVHPG